MLLLPGATQPGHTGETEAQAEQDEAETPPSRLDCSCHLFPGWPPNQECCEQVEGGGLALVPTTQRAGKIGSQIRHCPPMETMWAPTQRGCRMGLCVRVAVFGHRGDKQDSGPAARKAVP